MEQDKNKVDDDWFEILPNWAKNIMSGILLLSFVTGGFSWYSAGFRSGSYTFLAFFCLSFLFLLILKPFLKDRVALKYSELFGIMFALTLLGGWIRPDNSEIPTADQPSQVVSRDGAVVTRDIASNDSVVTIEQKKEKKRPSPQKSSGLAKLAKKFADARNGYNCCFKSEEWGTIADNMGISAIEKKGIKYLVIKIEPPIIKKYDLKLIKKMMCYIHEGWWFSIAQIEAQKSGVILRVGDEELVAYPFGTITYDGITSACPK